MIGKFGVWSWFQPYQLLKFYVFGYLFFILDVENEASLVHNVIDRDVYLRELDRLKPHAQILLTMLNEIRHKLREMDKSDPRLPTYK